MDLGAGTFNSKMTEARYWHYNSWVGYTIKDDEDRILVKGGERLRSI